MMVSFDYDHQKLSFFSYAVLIRRILLFKPHFGSNFDQ